MQDKSWILVHILLNHFHPKKIKEFLNILPPDDAKKILSHDVPFSDINPIFVNPREFFKNIHYSWIVPLIQNLPSPIKELTISALPVPLASGLKKHLKIQNLNLTLPKRSSFFFLKNLYKQIHPPQLLPPEFLPKEPLSILLNFSRKDLMALVDFLGLYDLAEEVKHLVDQKSLRNVYACLDNKKMRFLRLCLHQRSKFKTPKLNLQKWNGNCDTLSQMLHQRGLYRLGKALCGSHPDFLWHLSKKFDTGRSALLEKHYTKQESPGITSGLIQQVIYAINSLQHKDKM